MPSTLARRLTLLSMWAVLISGCGLDGVGADLDAWRNGLADVDAVEQADAAGDGADDAAADATVDVAQEADAGSDANAEDADVPDAQDSPDAQDAPDAVAVPPACTPGDCEDGNPCTVDTCVPAGCASAPTAAACDDGVACTGPDACQDGACAAGLPLVWTATDGELGKGNGWFAGRMLPDGGALLVGAQSPGDGKVPARGWVTRLDVHGAAAAAWLSDPGVEVQLAYAASRTDGGTVVVGRKVIADHTWLIAGVIPPDSVTPTSLQTYGEADVKALVLAPGDVAVVLSRAASSTAPERLAIDRIGPDGVALVHLLLPPSADLNARALGLDGEGFVIAGQAPGTGGLINNVGWLQRYDAAGQPAGPAQSYTCAGGTDHWLLAMTTFAGGRMLVGECQVDGVALLWVVRTDPMGKLLASVTPGVLGSAHAIVPLTDGTLLATGFGEQKPPLYFRPAAWKLDAGGQVLWQRVVDEPGVFGQGIAAPDGGALLPGLVGEDVLLTKTSATAVRVNAWSSADCGPGGACQGGASACDDDNPCTNESCDPAKGCATTANTVPCDDGKFCTGGDACLGGACKGGTQDPCDDGNVCTKDGCSAAKGCSHQPFPFNCDDGDACTAYDYCDAGACQTGGMDTNCDDGSPCTADGCDAKTGCTHVNLAIGTACGADKVCGNGKCVVPYAQALATGANSTCALRPGGAVACWGGGGTGQLGDGLSGASSLTPATVAVSPASAITVGKGFACALATKGQVWCWGDNDMGQTGATSGNVVALPTAVSLPAPAVAIAAGDSHACAITTAAEVWCWGDNGQNQLGASGGSGGPVPVQVAGLASATQLAAGGQQSCAVDQGQLMCWGRAKMTVTGMAKSDGLELLSLPEPPVQIAVSSGHGCALMADKSVRCWGINQFGELGSGVAGGASAWGPAKQIYELPAAQSVTVGSFHSCALLTDGQTWCWGLGLAGQLGDATPAPADGYSEAPHLAVQFTATGLAAREQHACAIGLDGSVACWGAQGFAGAPALGPAPVLVPGTAP